MNLKQAEEFLAVIKQVHEITGNEPRIIEGEFKADHLKLKLLITIDKEIPEERKND